jgi:hypothetical protein
MQFGGGEATSTSAQVFQAVEADHQVLLDEMMGEK